MTRNACFVLIAASLLAACNASPPETPAGASSEPAAASTVEVGNVAAREDLGFNYRPMPEGVSIETPFHVRSDRIKNTKSGQVRRVVKLEVLEGDGNSVADSIGRQLVASGYKPAKVKDDDREGDSVRTAFVRDGNDRVYVTVNADVGDDPANPDAKSLVTINWQLADQRSGPGPATDSGSSAPSHPPASPR